MAIKPSNDLRGFSLADFAQHCNLDAKYPISGASLWLWAATGGVSLMFVAAVVTYASDAAMPAAVDWAVGTLLGSVATGVAVLAVAFLGFGMLAGRIDWRSGVRVVLGIFILFGAPMIVRELMALARDGDAVDSGQIVYGEIPQQPVVPKNAPVSDPYAGAGLPQQ